MLIKAINLTVRFILELCALAALAYWGFHTGGETLTKVALGIGTPLLAALIWGMFGAPRARKPLTGLARVPLELLVFGGAALALADAGQPTLAWAFGIAVVINDVLLLVWK